MTYNVAANTATASRTGTLTIGGQTFTVTQAGAPCTFTIAADRQRRCRRPWPRAERSLSRPARDARGRRSATPHGSPSLAEPAGSGNGTVALQRRRQSGQHVADRHAHDRRSDLHGHQAGAPCTFSISPDFVGPGHFGGDNGHVTVTASCGLRVGGHDNTGWLSVTAGANGTGNGTVSLQRRQPIQAQSGGRARSQLRADLHG